MRNYWKVLQTKNRNFLCYIQNQRFYFVGLVCGINLRFNKMERKGVRTERPRRMSDRAGRVDPIARADWWTPRALRPAAWRRQTCLSSVTSVDGWSRRSRYAKIPRPPRHREAAFPVRRAVRCPPVSARVQAEAAQAALQTRARRPPAAQVGAVTQPAPRPAAPVRRREAVCPEARAERCRRLLSCRRPKTGRLTPLKKRRSSKC